MSRKTVLRKTVAMIFAFSFFAYSNYNTASIIADEIADIESSVSTDVIVKYDSVNVSLNCGDALDLYISRCYSLTDINFMFNEYTEPDSYKCALNISGKKTAYNISARPGASLGEMIRSVKSDDGRYDIVQLESSIILKADIDEENGEIALSEYYYFEYATCEDIFSLKTVNDDDIIIYNNFYYIRSGAEIELVPKSGWKYKDDSDILKIKCNGSIRHCRGNDYYFDDQALCSWKQEIFECDFLGNVSWDTPGDIYSAEFEGSYLTVRFDAGPYLNNASFLGETFDSRNTEKKIRWNKVKDDNLLEINTDNDRTIYEVWINGELIEFPDNNIVLSYNFFKNKNKPDEVFSIEVISYPKELSTTIQFVDEDESFQISNILDVKNGEINVPCFRMYKDQLYKIDGYQYSEKLYREISNDEIESTSKTDNNYYIECEENIGQLTILYTKMHSNHSEKPSISYNADVKKRNDNCIATSSMFIDVFEKENNGTIGINYNIWCLGKKDLISSTAKQSISGVYHSRYVFESRYIDDRFISINTFHMENGEFYADYEKPFNIYRDLKAPNLNVTNIPKEWASSSDNGVFTFNFTLDDNEDVPEDASDEVKRIYKDIINCRTENLTEIRSVTIGDYCFTNNNGTWEKSCLTDNAEVSENAESAPERPVYDVDLVPPSEYYTGEFTAKIYLTEKSISEGITGLNSDISITAEDICGNTVKNSDGSMYTVPVKIDTDAPEMKKLSANNVAIFPYSGDYKIAVVQGNNGVTFKAEASDKTSDIDKVEIELLDYDFRVITKYRVENGIFVPVSENAKNLTGFVRMTVYDKAGNKAEYYYSDKNNGEGCDFDPDIREAIDVVFDTTPPEIVLNTEESAEFEFSKGLSGLIPYGTLKSWSQNGQIWYDRFPSFKIKAYEPDELQGSGVRKLQISICGERKELDLKALGILASKMRAGIDLILEQDEEDGKLFSPVLMVNSKKYYIFGEKKFSLDENGKFSIVCTVSDAAENVSEQVSAEGYVDSGAPETSGKYSVSSADGGKVSVLKFGTFSNGKINITVDIKEKGFSSGLAGAVLYFAGEKYICEGNRIINGKASFTVPENDLLPSESVSDNNILFEVYDNVGNKTTFEGIYSEALSDVIVLEKNAPVVSEPVITRTDNGTAVFKRSDWKDIFDFSIFDHYDSGAFSESDETFPVVYTSDDQVWYGTDVTVKFESMDKLSKDSGLSSVKEETVTASNMGSMTGEEIRTFTEASDPENSAKTSAYTSIFSTSSDHDGKYVFNVTASDNAGNEKTGSCTVFTDITAPFITKIEYSCADGSSTAGNGVNGIVTVDQNGFSDLEAVRTAAYRYFFNKQIRVKVYASDIVRSENAAGAEIESASCGIREIRAYMTEDDADSCTRLVPDRTGTDEDGMFYAEFLLPENFKGSVFAAAVDNVSNISDIVSTDGVISETMSKHTGTHDGRPVSSVTAELPSTPYTDIDGNPLYNAPFNALLSITDIYSGIRSNEIRLSGTGFSTNIPTEISSGRFESQFSNDGWTTVRKDRNLYSDIMRRLYMDRNANGNRFSLTMTDLCDNTSAGTERIFSIDTTSPTVEAEYSGAQADNVFTNVYNGDRKVRININERNFDPSLVSTEGIGYLSDWTLTSGTRGSDNAVYSADAVFSEDGTYSFKVGFRDRCDNKAEDYKSEEFIIDKTAPVLSVSYDNDSAENGIYYKNTRKATVLVTEENFDPGRMQINVSDALNAENIPSVTAWRDNGSGVYQADVIFSSDGQYEFSITGTDKAGNKLTPFSDSFIIDTKSPDLRITGVKRANKDSVMPVISVDERYLDRKSVRLSLSGAKRGSDLELRGEMKYTENGAVFESEDFEKIKENDDVYTLTAYVKDKAGNEETQKCVFSVNRFGSNFIFDKETEEIKNKYINKEKDIVVYEINADEHDELPVILITHDLDTRSAEEGKDYSVECTGGEDDWYEYKYTIFSKNFSADGAYAVEIYTHDSAGNNNNSVSESKNAELLFGVDKTPPICTPVDFEANGSYQAEELTAHVLISDNIIPKGIDVFLNEEQISTKLEDKVCEFVIPNSPQAQTVRLVVYDMADNSREYVFDNIFVSTSFARVLVHKTWFRVALAGTAAVSAAGAFLLRRRKYKKILSGKY